MAHVILKFVNPFGKCFIGVSHTPLLSLIHDKVNIIEFQTVPRTRLDSAMTSFLTKTETRKQIPKRKRHWPSGQGLLVVGILRSRLRTNHPKQQGQIKWMKSKMEESKE